MNPEYLNKRKGVLKNLLDYWKSESTFNSCKEFKLSLVITKFEERKVNTDGDLSARSGITP